jgi:hypothetical protein
MYIVTGNQPQQLTLCEYLGIPEWKVDPCALQHDASASGDNLLIEKHGTGARRSSVATARGEGRRFPSADRGRGGGQLPLRLFLVGGSRS